MKNKKDSDLYKKGIRYKPNVNTLARNSERNYLGLRPDTKEDYLSGPLPRDVLDPIEKKLEW